jgi:hypothetical protein
MTIVDEVRLDWNKLLGDTLKEKFEQLTSFLYGEGKKLTDGHGLVGISCNQSVIYLLNMGQTYQDQITPTIVVNGIIEYHGRIVNYELWEDITMAPDEIFIHNNDEVVRITLDNFEIS